MQGPINGYTHILFDDAYICNIFIYDILRIVYLHPWLMFLTSVPKLNVSSKLTFLVTVRSNHATSLKIEFRFPPIFLEILNRYYIFSVT